MKLLVPHQLDPQYLARLRATDGVSLAILHIEHQRSFAMQLLAATLKRILPYRLYERLRAKLESSKVSLDIDGTPLETPVHGINALLTTWAFDQRTVARVIRYLPDLRWVHSMVTGVDHFDLEMLANRGIVLTSPRAVHARRIAEFVMAAIYADAKNLLEHTESTRNRRARFLASRELSELKIGIVGFGSIGLAIATLARTNGAQVIGYVRDIARAPTIAGVKVTSDLTTVLRTSDVLVLALPSTRQTRCLIGGTELGLLKPGATLINVGRGDTVEQTALVHALDEKRLRRAYLDVIEDPISGRPSFAPSFKHPLYQVKNIVFTGYSSSESENSTKELFEDFADNLQRYCQERELRNTVDLVAGY